MNNNEGRARRLLVIYNPTAGSRARRRLAGWLACLDRQGAAVTLRETTGPRHAEELARAADPTAVDAVIVAGPNSLHAQQSIDAARIGYVHRRHFHRVREGIQ